MTTRRGLIAAMGLGPAAVASEAFLSPPVKGESVRIARQAYTNEHFAHALEVLAAEVRSGKIEMVAMNFNSSIKCDDFVDRHTITLDVFHLTESS